MFHYDYFVAVAALIRSVDPDLKRQDFSVAVSDFDDDWRNILHDCSEVKADVLVNEHHLIVNVEFDDRYDRFNFGYQPVSDRKIKALEFLKKFKTADSVLAKAMYDVFMKYESAQLYEEQKKGRTHYGVKVGDQKVYEGTVKIDAI